MSDEQKTPAAWDRMKWTIVGEAERSGVVKIVGERRYAITPGMASPRSLQLHRRGKFPAPG